MVRWLALLPILAFSTAAAAANGLDLNVNDNAVRVTGELELRRDIMVDASIYHHDDRGEVFGVGLHATGAATGGSNPLRAGLGARLFRIDSSILGEDSGTALPLGGFMNYRIPGYNRFSVGGSLYYAPDVLSFSDVRKYWEYNAWAAYDVFRAGQVYLGVRGIKADFERSPEVTFDTGMHVGLRLRF
jgi:hypothetical protein